MGHLEVASVAFGIRGEFSIRTSGHGSCQNAENEVSIKKSLVYFFGAVIGKNVG